jgi:hypothetical protein
MCCTSGWNCVALLSLHSVSLQTGDREALSADKLKTGTPGKFALQAIVKNTDIEPHV